MKTQWLFFKMTFVSFTVLPPFYRFLKPSEHDNERAEMSHGFKTIKQRQKRVNVHERGWNIRPNVLLYK